MGLIPAAETVPEGKISEVRAELQAKEAVLATLQVKEADSKALVAKLTAECGDASAQAYIQEAAGASDEELSELRDVAAAKMTELDKARAEHTALGHACTVAAGQCDAARLAVIRTEHKSQILRLNRLCERWLRAGIKVSKILGDYTDAWRELCARTEDIRAAWPQSLPELPLLNPRGGLFAAVQLELYRQSAQLNDLCFADPTGAARAPGAKSGLEFNPERIKPLVDEMDEVRAWLASVLEGRVDGRTGQPTATAEPITEPAPAAPAA